MLTFLGSPFGEIFHGPLVVGPQFAMFGLDFRGLSDPANAPHDNIQKIHHEVRQVGHSGDK